MTEDADQEAVRALPFAAWICIDAERWKETFPNADDELGAFGLREVERALVEAGGEAENGISCSQDERGCWLFVCRRNGNDLPTLQEAVA
jgi:hypothetical protein